MNGTNHTGTGDSPAPAPPPGEAAARRRTPWPLVALAVLFVVAPFLAWYGTWFGRELDEEQVGEYLRDEQKPRRVQHALSQVADRITAGDAGAARWYPQVAALAAHPEADVRMTAAWVMGIEHRAEEFHAALVGLLGDREPVVRRNAALALVRFGDARARPELLAMLRPYPVAALAAGTALTVLSEGTPVKRESLLARLEAPDGARHEVRSPLPGRVEKTLVSEGERVEVGRELFLVAPDAGQVRDALIGLQYFGGEEDLAELERFARGVEGMPEEVKQQAARTVEAVRRRSSRNGAGGN